MQRKAVRSATRDLALVLLLASAAFAQSFPHNTRPSVKMLPFPVASVQRGKPTPIDLQFQISRGFHINSNQPGSEFLIPTTLKLDPPTDIVIGKTTYPPGENRAFPFSPGEKLSVYSGDFPIDVVVQPLRNVVPGKYLIRGRLKYQACDNRACYPPKELPVAFEVRVKKAAAAGRHSRQSPHVHH